MPEGRTQVEHRKHRRVESRIRCWCEGENVTFYARVGNLSEGGLFLRTSTPLSRGMKAKVRLSADSVELETMATVMWARNEANSEGPPGMGLQFETLPAEKLSLLRELITRESRTRPE